MTLQAASTTMKAACAARAAHAAEIADDVSPRIVRLLPDAEDARRLLDDGSRGLFSRSVLLRSRYFGEIHETQAARRDQLVLLSAGLDVRSLAMPCWRGKAIFAVDHPSSQALCRDLLERAGIALPSTRFVPLDLVGEPPGALLGALIEAGLDPERPTLVVWEGATYYLPRPTVHAQLCALGRNFAAARVAVDLLCRDAYLRDGQPANEGVARNLEFLRRLGEPWIGFFDPEETIAIIRAAGLGKARSFDRADLERRLLGESLMQPGSMFFLEADTEVSNEW